MEKPEHSKKREDLYKKIVLFVAIFACIAGYLALPQAQTLINIIFRTQPDSGKTVTIQLPANAHWFDTGIIISRGQRLIISASGRVILTSERDTRYGPNGKDEFGNDSYPCELLKGSLCVINGIRYGVLIAKVGEGSPFEVGSSFDSLIADSGLLYLTLNDNLDYYSDNLGTCKISITIR